MGEKGGRLKTGDAGLILVRGILAPAFPPSLFSGARLFHPFPDERRSNRMSRNDLLQLLILIVYGVPVWEMFTRGVFLALKFTRGEFSVPVAHSELLLTFQMKGVPDGLNQSY